MYLIFDTETTGLPRNFKAPITETDNWPRVVQLAWQLHDEMGRLLSKGDSLIRPNGFNIPYDSEKVHGISTALAVSEGRELSEVLADFKSDLSKASFIVGHNLKFDINAYIVNYFYDRIDKKIEELQKEISSKYEIKVVKEVAEKF